MDTLDLHFPKAGVDVANAFCRQPNRPAVDGQYARTTPYAVNVRTFDALGRSRGGSRQGIRKYVEAQPGDVEFITQDLSVLVTTGIADPGGGTVEASQSGRLVLLIAVSEGNVYTCPSGGSEWTLATNSTSPLEDPPLNYTGLMQSSANNQLLFFADGINWCYYNPTTDEVFTWVATDGTLPEDGDGNTPRLICTWRGRIVLSGILLDPSLIAMSAISDPFDFDYAPAVPVPASAAWAGNVAPQGLMSDVVTALIPYSDDTLIVGMDSSIAIFRGDPNDGGSIDLVTTSTGIAWGKAWAMDPAGTVYFFANRTGVFRMVPGAQPLRMSQPIDNLLQDINTGEYNVLLQWNDRYQQLHVWVTLLNEPAATTHYVWEQRSQSWWLDEFANPNHNPLCCVTFDGNLPNDRQSLIGSWDGYVRSVSADAPDDDGEPILSEVWIGPFLTKYNDSVMLHEVQGVMGSGSDPVSYNVYVDQTAEAALVSTSVANGIWGAGRNFTDAVRRAGYAAYVQLTAAGQWAMENIRCTVYPQGSVRRKGK